MFRTMEQNCKRFLFSFAFPFFLSFPAQTISDCVCSSSAPDFAPIHIRVESEKRVRDDRARGSNNRTNANLRRYTYKRSPRNRERNKLTSAIVLWRVKVPPLAAAIFSWNVCEQERDKWEGFSRKFSIGSAAAASTDCRCSKGRYWSKLLTGALRWRLL